MGPPRGSSIQGGGGETRSKTAASIGSIRRSSRSSIQSNMIYASTTEDEPESAEEESSVDEHRRKDTEYHEKIQQEKLMKARERRAREKEEKERQKQVLAARQAEKNKGKGGDNVFSSSESEVDADNEVRRSPRKAQPVVQVESKLLSQMKRFSQLPKELWEKPVQRKSKAQPSQEPPDVDHTTPVAQGSSDGSKENAEEMETPPPPVYDEGHAESEPGQSSKAKKVSTATGNKPVRASPRKKQPIQQEKQNEDQRDNDSFTNKALLTSTPYPGGAVAWKNGPSLPDPDMSPVTPQNKDDRGTRNVIPTQKSKSQAKSRIPVVLPVKLAQTDARSSSSTPPEVPSVQQKEADSADNEETPISLRRSPRKSATFSAARASAAAFPSTSQKNGTFNVTHGFGGTARPKVVRTPLNRQAPVQDKDKSHDTSVSSSEEVSPQTGTSRSKNEYTSQEHATGVIEKRSVNMGARLRRSIKAAVLGAENSSSDSDDEPVIPLPRRTSALSMSRPKPLDSPTVTTGTSQPGRLSKKSLPQSRLSQLPKESQTIVNTRSQQESQQSGSGDAVKKDTEENASEGRVSTTSAIHASPTGRPEKSGLDRRSKQHTTATITSAPVAESSSLESDGESAHENNQEENDFAEKPRVARSDRRTRPRQTPDAAGKNKPEPEKPQNLETEPEQMSSRSTKKTAKAATEPQTTKPPSAAASPRKARKGKAGKLPQAPPEAEIPEINESEDDEPRDPDPETQPVQKTTRRTKAAVEAVPVLTEPGKNKRPSAAVSPRKQRKGKAVPPPQPSPESEIPEGNDSADDEPRDPDPETQLSQKSTRRTRAAVEAVPVLTEPRTNKPPSAAVSPRKPKKGKTVPPPQPSPESEIPEGNHSADDEPRDPDPETQPSQKSTRRTRAALEAVPVLTEPRTNKPPSTAASPRKPRKGKAVPPPQPSPEVNASADDEPRDPDPETQPSQKSTRRTRAAVEAVPGSTEPGTNKPPSAAASPRKPRKGKAVPPPQPSPEVDTSADDEPRDPEENDFAEKPRVARSDRRTRPRQTPDAAGKNKPEPEKPQNLETEPVQMSSRSTKTTAKAATEPQTTKPPSAAASPRKPRKGKAVPPPQPSPESEIPEGNESADEKLRGSDTEPSQKATRRTRAAMEAVPDLTEPEKNKRPSAAVSPRKPRKEKAVPPPQPSPEVNDLAADEPRHPDPETQPSQKSTRRPRAVLESVPGSTELGSNKPPSVAVSPRKPRKRKAVQPPQPSPESEIPEGNESADDEPRDPDPETQPSQKFTRRTRAAVEAVPVSTEPGTNKPLSKARKGKVNDPKAADFLPKPKSKKIPAVMLPAPKRGRPRGTTKAATKQKSPTAHHETSNSNKLDQESASPVTPRPRGRPSKASLSRVQTPPRDDPSVGILSSPQTPSRPTKTNVSSPQTPRSGRLSSASPSPRITAVHHRDRPISTSPPSHQILHHGSPFAASQPIPEAYRRSRISIQQTSRVLPASQPLPGTSAVVASRSVSSHSSFNSIRTKENRRRSIFEIARARSASDSPPRKKKKVKKAEKTPERYVGTDIFGNYHLLNNEDFVKILNEERPNHGLGAQDVNHLSIRINHFLEDFFTHHCEETPHPLGFISFGDLRTALDEQCLVEENCSADDLLQEMKKAFPKEDWKRSEDILYPGRYSKKQDNEDYLFK